MEEARERNLESGREKYSSFVKKRSNHALEEGQLFPKYQDSGDQNDPNTCTPASSSLSPFSMTSTDEPIEFSQQDEHDMLVANAEEAAVQHARLASSAHSNVPSKYNAYLINKIKELEERITTRDMMVTALQRELDLFKDVSIADASAGPLTSTTFSSDRGDSSQPLGPPQTKNEEFLIISLKHKDTEISLLKEEIRRKGQACHHEQFSNRIYVLECEVKEQAETIEQLNLEVVQKTKMLDRVQDQLQKKSEDFNKQNMKTSVEIKHLMRNVEELGHEVLSKDNELKQAKEELSALRRDLEHNFYLQLADVKEQLKLSHDEEKGQVNGDLLFKFKSHETEVACYKKQIEALTNRVQENFQSENELQTELEACRLAYDAQIVSYKECIESLMEEIAAVKERSETEFKRQVEKYKMELEKCCNELENYRQQLKDVDIKLAEEKKMVEKKYTDEISSIRRTYETEFVIYKCCTESLRKKEQTALEEVALVKSQCQESICELEKQLENVKEKLNDTNIKLLESHKNEKNLAEELAECKVELQKYIDKDHLLTQQLHAKELNEELIVNEMNKYRDLVVEYETKMKDVEKLRADMASVEVKHESEIGAFQNQIDHLMSTLTDIKSKHKQEVNELVEELMVLHQQTEALYDLADCDNIDMVREKLKEHKACKNEIELLNENVKKASSSATEFENRLIQLQLRYESDISLYKNQIETLKDELSAASCLEENLVQQLNQQVSGVKESKEQIKDLLLRKDIQVYYVENETSCNNYADSSSSTKELCNSKFQNESEPSEGQGEISDEMKLLFNQLEHVSYENQSLKQELDNLKKPKCNVSLQLHESNELQKRHIEQALCSELEKALHVSELECNAKEKDIQELVKANNDLADQYNILKAEYRDLENISAQQAVEIGLLQNENERLDEERLQLASGQNVLMEKLQSLTENSSDTANEDNLYEEHLNLDEGCPLNLPSMRKLFKNVATSTPNLVDNRVYDEDDNENDVLTPKRNFADYNYRTNQMLSRWMSNCGELEDENSELKKEIELLKLQLNEMECCSDAIKSQMGSYEENCESLKARILELEAKKKVVRELELMNEQLNLRNEKLEEDRDILRRDIAALKEENVSIEKKYEETIANILAQNINENIKSNPTFENLVYELNKKSESVIMLKEELFTKQETVTNLEDKLCKFLDFREEMSSRYAVLIEDLKTAEEEVLKLRQEYLNIGLEKRLSDKKLVVLKEQNEQLLKHFCGKVKKNCNNGVISIVEELEKELVELHKNLSAERGVIERMAVEKNLNKNSGNCSEGSETSYKIELLLHAFEQLQNERECLKMKTLELQEIINKYVNNNEVDETWKLEVKESQKKLLCELETYGKHRADLGKSLLDTEDLKEKVELAEKELLQKIQEKNNIENLLAVEQQGLRSALKRINYLENQLCEKMGVVEALGAEKEDLEDNLVNLQGKLSDIEVDLQRQKIILQEEIKERDLRVRHAHLDLHVAELDKRMIVSDMVMKEEAETKVEEMSQLRENIEKQHDMAISRLKRLYTTQLHEVIEGAAAEQQVIQQNHHEQVMMPYMLSTATTAGTISMKFE